MSCKDTKNIAFDTGKTSMDILVVVAATEVGLAVDDASVETLAVVFLVGGRCFAKNFLGSYPNSNRVYRRQTLYYFYSGYLPYFL